MLSFVRSALGARRVCSHLAIAVAVTTATVALTAGAAAPAYAKEKAGKANYSKGFVGAYQPLNDKFSKDSDLEAVKAGIPAMVAAVETEDDRFAAGNFLFNVAVKTKDTAMQRQGVEMMLQSGKVAPENLGQYNLLAGQLAYNTKDYEAARKYLQTAADAGYNAADAGVLIAESYFAENREKEGLDYLSQEIAKKKAAGEPIDPSWLKRGFAMAYEASLGTEAADYGAMLAKADPNPVNWGNAIGVLRIYGDYDDQGTLDLMRLAKRTDSLKTDRDYVDYIEAADARRLPAEVNSVVESGISAGKLKANDVFVAEAKNTASGRLAQDKKDLPSLASDARKASATAATAMAAGDAFLSWSDAATAEEMYTIALSKPGVDSERVLTRLGIAQVDQGKFDAAEQTFAKITGKRKPIARLWTIYAEQKASGGAPAAAAQPAPAAS